MIVATMRHSGSRFAKRVLEQQQRQPVERIRHVEKANAVWLAENIPQHIPLIMTMRHPLKVTQSWRNRGRTIDPYYLNAWEMLFQFKNRYEDSLWFPIDTVDRDEYLHDISERLEFDFQTDWAPFGSNVRGDKPADPGFNDSECLRFFRTLPFEQFGYELDLDG